MACTKNPIEDYELNLESDSKPSDSTTKNNVKKPGLSQAAKKRKSEEHVQNTAEKMREFGW